MRTLQVEDKDASTYAGRDFPLLVPENKSLETDPIAFSAECLLEQTVLQLSLLSTRGKPVIETCAAGNDTSSIVVPSTQFGFCSVLARKYFCYTRIQMDEAPWIHRCKAISSYP